ncbi:MAG: DUF6788 family protein [Bryobacteraceae bacterium]
MSLSLAELEQQRTALARQISELGDFRPGSITGTGDRCGSRGCHCHRRKDPGHAPHPPWPQPARPGTGCGRHRVLTRRAAHDGCGGQRNRLRTKPRTTRFTRWPRSHRQSRGAPDRGYRQQYRSRRAIRNPPRQTTGLARSLRSCRAVALYRNGRHGSACRKSRDRRSRR